MATAMARPRISDLPPAKRLEVLRRVQDIKAGRLRLPGLRCGGCRGTILDRDRHDASKLECGQCGHTTPLADAKIARQREIEAIILNGPLG